MNRRWSITIAYSAAHFAVDFGCAFAMFSRCSGSPVNFLLYNFFAFAMQMPLGILADIYNCNRRFAVCGVLLTAAVCLLPEFGVLGSVFLGLGNGLFHVGGGLDVLNLSEKTAAPLGVFVSPGAFGVYLGTLTGNAAWPPIPVIGTLLLACAVILLFCRKHRLPANAETVLPDKSVLPCAVLLFLVVILRSYGGMSASFDWKTGIWSLAAVTVVVLGKTLGGFAGDRFGLFPTAAVSLGASAILFFFSDYAVPGIIALLLFNMTMPMTLYILAQLMRGTKGFSFGLLTFALFLGFLPSYLGAGTISGVGMAVVAIASALLLLPAIRRS